MSLPSPEPELRDLDPGELLARALETAHPSPGAARWVPPTAEELSRLLPQYRIESLLGCGGMGAVYKGMQPSLDRPVAIKLLPAEMAEDAQFVERFQREARTLGRLQHPRIVTVHDSGQTPEGHLYFVMEYIDGTDLRRVLRGPGLDPEQALGVVGQLCDALQAAHREGIVHRDIKPENVLITRDGYVKLADFGLARAPQQEGEAGLTHPDVVMGTPAYMAPEQFAGAARADHRSDIFALGVMFYEMLTGQRPGAGMFDPPSRKVQLDVRIDEVVLKALQSEPEQRYQNVGELKSEVERIRSTPPPPLVPPAPRARRGGLVAAILVLVLASGGYVLRKNFAPGEPIAAAASGSHAASPLREPLAVSSRAKAGDSESHPAPPAALLDEFVKARAAVDETSRRGGDTLRKAMEKALVDVANDASLSVNDRLAIAKILEAERRNFEEQGLLPFSARVRSATNAYVSELRAAWTPLESVCNKLIDFSLKARDLKSADEYGRERLKSVKVVARWQCKGKFFSWDEQYFSNGMRSDGSGKPAGSWKLQGAQILLSDPENKPYPIQVTLAEDGRSFNGRNFGLNHPYSGKLKLPAPRVSTGASGTPAAASSPTR